jgi:hypothetical protein
MEDLLIIVVTLACFLVHPMKFGIESVADDNDDGPDDVLDDVPDDDEETMTVVSIRINIQNKRKEGLVKQNKKVDKKKL